MATGRIYTVTFENVTVSAAQDLFEIQPATNKPVRFLALYLSNASNTDVGDAQEELLRWQVIRGYTSSGSAGGTNPTPRPVGSSANSAAGFTCEINNTTLANTGTVHILHSDIFNVRVPLPFVWTPECQPGASAADTTIVVRLLAAPADSLTLTGTLYVEELG